MRALEDWRERARSFEIDVVALYLACRDPRVPWYAKALAAGIAGYAFSPIDLIPDFIPILGWLDDLVLIPLGVIAVRRMIPAEVWAACRARARDGLGGDKPRSHVAAAVIVTIWILTALAAGWLVFRWVR